MGNLWLKVEALILLIATHVVRGVSRAGDPATIVVTHLTTNIGDMICATPVFRALAVQYPMARILVVGTVKNGLLLEGFPGIEYIPFQGTWKTISVLRRLHPSFGIALNPSPRELGILYLAGAARVSVFTNPAFGGRAFRVLSHRALTVPYEPGVFVPRQYLKLLKPFGVTDTNARPQLAVAAEVVRASTAHHLRPFAVIAPAAGHRFKEWPRERFDALARALIDYGLEVVIVGQESLEELKALVFRAAIVVSNDSGVAQIAYAFDTPSVVIAGVTDWREHHEPSARHRVVAVEGDFKTQSFISDHDHISFGDGALPLITVDRVTEEVKNVLTFFPPRTPVQY